MFESTHDSAVQEFMVSYLDDELLGSRQQGLLIIGPGDAWKLVRLDPKGRDETVFDLPAGKAWQRLEQLDATGAIWESTQNECVTVYA